MEQAKDLAYRVVADNLDARYTNTHTVQFQFLLFFKHANVFHSFFRATTVADIMTKNPMCVTADTSAQDALNLMVSRGFRHLVCALT